jgi:hypothetical protein
MKKTSDILLAVITVFGLPAIVLLAFKDFYFKHTSLIWYSTLGLATLLSLAVLQLKLGPSWNKTVRTIRFYIFRTKNIAIFLTFQVAIVLSLLFVKEPSSLELKNAILYIGINLLAVNILIATGKISNSDRKQLALHCINDGRIYLQTNNRLRYVPEIGPI